MDVKTYAVCIGAPWGWKVVEAAFVGLDIYFVVANKNGYIPPIPNDDCPEVPRYMFFLNWSHIVPPAVAESFECCNFHATPLPLGRGGGPIENMILRGHTETVITAHRMTQEIDAGPIYGVSEPVSLAGTKNEILARFVEPVTGLIRMIIEEEPEPVPQQGEVVEFKRLEQSEYEKFWATRALMTDESLWRVIGE